MNQAEVAGGSDDTKTSRLYYDSVTSIDEKSSVSPILMSLFRNYLWFLKCMIWMAMVNWVSKLYINIYIYIQ